MATNNNQNINKDNVGEWLRSLGYLFPQNEKELARFEKLYDDYEFELNEEDIDPSKILQKEDQEGVPLIQIKKYEVGEDIRLAARNLYEKLPQHIVDKMKEKQKGDSDDDQSGS
jgi:hypothetical protein